MSSVEVYRPDGRLRVRPCRRANNGGVAIYEGTILDVHFDSHQGPPRQEVRGAVGLHGAPLLDLFDHFDDVLNGSPTDVQVEGGVHDDLHAALLLAPCGHLVSVALSLQRT